MKVDQAKTARIAWPLLRRLAAASDWSPGRIAGETVLTVVLAGIAGSLDAVAAGFGGRTAAVVAGVALLSLTRRALPATVLIVSAAVAGVLFPVLPLLVYASWSAGSRIMKPWRVVGAFAAALVLHLALSVHDEIRVGSDLSLPAMGALNAGAFLAPAIVPGLTARYRAQRRALLDALRRNNEQLVREQAMVAREARLLERNRIAQDMHDSLGHQLALIAVHAGALQVDPELTDRQREGVGILRDASVTAMGELREAVGVLHGDRDDRSRPDDGRTEHAGRTAGQTPGTVAGTDGPGPRPAPQTVASIDGLVESRPGSRARPWSCVGPVPSVRWRPPPTTRRTAWSRRA